MASSSTQPSTPGPGYIIDGRYRIIKKIGSGGFGDVFQIKNVNTNEELAVKMENVEARQPELHYESQVYKNLEGGLGIPRTYYFGTERGYNALVMDHLGPSLDDLFAACDGRFRLKTVLMLADQLLARMEHIHRNNFIHRDIKPENLLMGLGDQANILFLIDFGMAKRFRDPTTFDHIAFRADIGFAGTSRYASINAHLGYEQSRRDDLEALGYIFVYFLKGSLPWQGLTAATPEERNEKVKAMKMGTTFEVLCKDLPSEFVEHLKYCRNLRFEQDPDYKYLSSIFRKLFIAMNYEYDNNFDWMRHMKVMAQPVAGPSRPTQPPVSRQFKHPVLRCVPPRKEPVFPRKNVPAPPPRRSLAQPPPPPPARKGVAPPLPPPRRK